MRPFERDAVYAAEAAAPAGVRFRSPEQMRAYVRAVTGSEWWQARGWPEAVAVRVSSPKYGPKAAARGGRSLATGWFVRFPSFADEQLAAQYGAALECGRPVPDWAWPWAWCEVVVAHELAHVSLLAEPVVYDRDHGPVFCRRHLELTASLAGPDVADALAASYDAHGVLWYPPIRWDTTVGVDARAAAGCRDIPTSVGSVAMSANPDIDGVPWAA